MEEFAVHSAPRRTLRPHDTTRHGTRLHCGGTQLTTKRAMDLKLCSTEDIHHRRGGDKRALCPQRIPDSAARGSNPDDTKSINRPL
ncbi:hypothetical protein RR48_09064 [Papilio machaon]|uniref:Uncharacterized protein n=1 Tax=Papilio machaon TaxID=76193 RepID=A0A194RBQ3_PAPMA|nr:hypothetical protein RR48_09064 [Papilio machaon]